MWQPIATAPKDGSAILALLPYDWAGIEHDPPLAVIRWSDRIGDWFFPLPGNYVQLVEFQPTLWMPIEPPNTGIKPRREAASA